MSQIIVPVAPQQVLLPPPGNPISELVVAATGARYQRNLGPLTDCALAWLVWTVLASRHADARNFLCFHDDQPTLLVGEGEGVRASVVTPAEFDRLFATHIHAPEWTKGAGGHLPDALRRITLAMARDTLPKVDAIELAPSIEPDGAVTTQPGYDSVSKTFFAVPEGVSLESLTDADAIDVLRRLTDFSFERPADRAMYTAFLLTGLRRRAARPATPGLLIDGPSGSGKTTAATTIGHLLLGRQATLRPAPSAFEVAYQLPGLIKAAHGLLLFDEVQREPGFINHGLLVSAMTATAPGTYRPVGGGKLSWYDPRGLLLVGTGIEPDFDHDAARRWVRIRLEPRSATVMSNSLNPAEFVLQNRVLCLSAALRLARRGPDTPQRLSAPALASFGAWCREGLRVLFGLKDDEGNALSEEFLRREACPKSGVDVELERLFQSWPEGTTGKTEHCLDLDLRGVITLIEENGLTAIARHCSPGRGGLSRVKLGKFLTDHEGRFLGGRALRKTRNSSGVRYRVVRDSETETQRWIPGGM